MQAYIAYFLIAIFLALIILLPLLIIDWVKERSTTKKLLQIIEKQNRIIAWHERHAKKQVRDFKTAKEQYDLMVENFNKKLRKLK